MPATPTLTDRRREALLTATRLQRRNVAARWGQLKDNRVVGWAESGKTLIDAMRGSSSLRGAASGSLTTILSSALWAVRERSSWGILAMAAKWWLRRRDRQRLRAESLALPPRRRPQRPSFFSRIRRAH